MLLELMTSGHLAHWWEYPVFVLAVLTVVAGPTAIRLILLRKPLPGGEDSGADSGIRSPGEAEDPHPPALPRRRKPGALLDRADGQGAPSDDIARHAGWH